MTVIRVGAEPEPFAETGLYFDGDTAVGDLAQLRIDEASRELVLNRIGFVAVRWPLDMIRQVPDQAGDDRLVLRQRDDPVARLILADRLILARLPDVNKPAPQVRRRRLTAWALSAVGSVALIILVLVPKMADQLANFIPPEGERALGEVTLDQIRQAQGLSGNSGSVALCKENLGWTALLRIQDRLLSASDETPEISVHVLDHSLLNAFALPGGYVVFFRGLIDAAESPEEVAAVFAHEIGHVVSRDPTRHALRSAGSIGVLGLLLGDFAGGALVLFLTERLIEASYSRDSEAAADAFGRQMMIDAGIDPGAMGTFFARLRTGPGDDSGFFAHFASHPALSDRILAAESPAPTEFVAHPLMSEEEWTALKGICG